MAAPPWQRDVAVDASGDLVITNKPPNPNPAAPAKHDPRYDTELEVEIFPIDRQGGGAQIRYHATANDLELTGIKMKDGSSIPTSYLDVRVTGGGRVMTLTITDTPTNEDWDYYVVGKVNVGKADEEEKTTLDPRIRNRAQ